MLLVANALYWLRTYIDGLRVDAVAHSMLYLLAQGRPVASNQYGGARTWRPSRFIQECRDRRHPGIVAVAEESTAWPAVSAGPPAAASATA